VAQKGDHTHKACSLREVAKGEVPTAVKRKASDELHVKPNKIMRRELQRKVESSQVLEYSDFDLLHKSAYNCRHKKLPTLPRSLDDAFT